MGKGFQNFMSKKDFHPSAWWNLKKVWEAKEKKKLDEQKQEELRIQYEKEQEIMHNKALLGDEKAKLGLSFMYDAPTGMAKREEPKEEPKFEWQRKYNAPREEWAKGNDAIQDQPFGIQVRNVRCVKCHTWGHLNTDRECPMFNMSGNADNPGYANNPSDLLKELEKEKEEEKKAAKQQKEAKDSDDDESGPEEEEVKVERIDQVQLLADMKEDHGFNFKKNILQNIRSDDVLTKITTKAKANEDVQALLKGLDDKMRLKVLKKTFGKDSKEYKAELAAVEEAKAAKKAAKAEKKAKKKEKKSSSSKKVKREVVSESSSDSASSDSESEVERRTKQKSKRREDSDDDRDRRRPQKSHSRHESRDRKHKRHESDSDDDEDRTRRKRRRSDSYERSERRTDRRDRNNDRRDDYDRRDRRRRSRSRERR